MEAGPPIQLTARVPGRERSLSPDGSLAPMRTPAQESDPPEGGYGWIVVLSCSVLTFFFVGTSYSWGIFQGYLVQRGLASSSTLAFVGSTTVACISFLALINAKIIRVLGAKWTGFLGAALLGIGEILSGFTTDSVGGLFATAGIITGVGTSLCFMTCSVMPAQYFKKRRGLANGMVYAGGGLGGAAISLSLDALLQKLGPAWTFRVIGLTTLGIACPAALALKERSSPRLTHLVEWNLLRDFSFVVLFFAGAVATFPLFVPPFFLPLYNVSLGLSASAGAAMVSGFNLSSAFGRLGFGQLSDSIGPLNALLVSLILSAVSMLAIWPLSTSLVPLVIFVILNGAANGGFFSLMPTVVGTVFGSSRVSVAMGMIVTGWAGGYLMGAPIAGYLLTAYGGPDSTLSAYRPAMYYAGSMALASAGMVATVRLRLTSKLFARV